MAAIKKVDISEQKEIVLASNTEQKTTTSQSLKIKAASGQKNEIPTIQLLKREPQSNGQRKAREEVKIQRLKDTTKSQQEKIANLERELAETVEALSKEREEKQELSVKVCQQNQTITDTLVALRHFKSEAKQNNRDKEDAITQLTKSELDKKDLTAMFRSANKEGCKINKTLKKERERNKKQMRQLKEVQNKACDLQNENTELYNKVATLQNKVASLKSDRAKLQNMNFAQEIDVKLFQKLFMEDERRLISITFEHADQKEALENEMNDYKQSVEEYKNSLKEATTLLEKTEKDKKTISQQLRSYKARSDRRGKIIQADKETKAEMKNTIERLQEENERLQAKLNSGFTGRYRSMKRYLARAINAILSRF